MDISGKTAIVVGASSGLGKAVTEQLVEEGVKVVALARTINEVELPSSVLKIPLNIRDLKSIDDAFAVIDSKTDTIDFLINCAGRSLKKKFEEVSREEIMDVFGINLKGNIYMALEVYKRMIPKAAGHIINVISTSGLKGRELETIYCASKWGLRGFTESLRLEAHNYGIRVSAVIPGGMRSKKFWDNTGTDYSKYMEPKVVAVELINLLKTDPSVSPSELILERM